MKQMSVVIDEKGKVKVEVEGVTGSTCQQLTEDLLSKLGTGKTEQLKDEFFMTQGDKNHVYS